MKLIHSSVTCDNDRSQTFSTFSIKNKTSSRNQRQIFLETNLFIGHRLVEFSNSRGIFELVAPDTIHPLIYMTIGRILLNRFDDEINVLFFFKRWNKGALAESDTETTVSSSTSEPFASRIVNSSMGARLSKMKIDEDDERMSDIEGQTDPDELQSETDKEELRQIFGVSHALETFDDYEDIKQSINRDTTLPVYAQKEKILSIIEKNSITIIQGNTGSGKSTQIPQYILDDYVHKRKAVNIVVSQPRRIAARSLCEHISHSRHWPVGQTVGYQTSLNKQRCELTRILYCTTGVLLQRLILTKTLQDFTHILLDELSSMSKNLIE